MQNWITLIPPIFVIVTAIYTKKVIPALLTGIISASFIATHGNILKSISLIIKRMAEEANIDIFLYQTNESPDHIYTFAFLILLGIIIGLVTHTGGLSAYSTWLKKKLHTAKNVQTTSVFLSALFFLDDYLSCLTVGAIMKPVTDSFKLPRVKLAYLLDSVSAAFCVLIPATSWVATVLTQLQVAGVVSAKNAYDPVIVAADPFFTYLNAMPFFIYPITIVISTLFIIKQNISYGPMRNQELLAQNTGNLYGGKEPLQSTAHITKDSHGNVIDFLFPVLSFIGAVILFILYLGDWVYFGGSNNLMLILQSVNMLKALFFASLTSVIISLLFVLIRKSLAFNIIPTLVKESWHLMFTSFVILFLAWTFSSLLKNDLETGSYIAHTLLSAIPNFIIPLMVFLTALLVTASTSSAWGAITVIVPLAVPLALQNIQTIPVLLPQVPLLPAILGALISGSVAGGHVSSISDAVVIASISSSSYHIDHFITQFAYILPIVISCCIGYLVIGLTLNALFGLAISIGLSLLSLWILNNLLKNK